MTQVANGTQHKGLLDWLVADNLITAEQRHLITQQQQHLDRVTGKHYLSGELLLEAGWVSKPALRKTLSKMGVGLTADLQSLLPRDLCHKYQVIPMRQSGSVVVIAAAVIISEAVIKDIEVEAGAFYGTPITIEVVAAAQAQINLGIRKLAGNKNGVVEAMRELDEDAENGFKLKDLVHELLMESVSMGASDAHFEYVGDRPARCFVSYRVDGVKKRMHLLPPKIMVSVLRTMKMNSGMDASDTRRFQDGRMDFQYQNRQIDMRMHSNAMSGGEYMVIRFLDRESLRSLHDLMPNHTEITAELRRLTSGKSKESGVLLVTGPTGSGKTTTLYAAIMGMDRHLLNVMTIEEPVEFDLPFVQQLAFNPTIYKSFAGLLPSVLRSDPDVVVLGELRDEETAVPALRFAESGHLMMSTLHANDAWQTYERFVNMMNPDTRHISIGIFAQTIKAVLNQTLLPNLCPHCSKPADAETLMLATRFFGGAGQNARTANSDGCELCDSGFAPGRVCLPEAIFFNTSTEARSKLSRLLLGGKNLYEALTAEPTLARTHTRQKTLIPLVSAGLVDIHTALNIVGAYGAGNH